MTRLTADNNSIMWNSIYLVSYVIFTKVRLTRLLNTRKWFFFLNRALRNKRGISRALNEWISLISWLIRDTPVYGRFSHDRDDFVVGFRLMRSHGYDSLPVSRVCASCTNLCRITGCDRSARPVLSHLGNQSWRVPWHDETWLKRSTPESKAWSE